MSARNRRSRAVIIDLSDNKDSPKEKQAPEKQDQPEADLDDWSDVTFEVIKMDADDLDTDKDKDKNPDTDIDSDKDQVKNDQDVFSIALQLPKDTVQADNSTKTVSVGGQQQVDFDDNLNKTSPVSLEENDETSVEETGTSSPVPKEVVLQEPLTFAFDDEDDVVELVVSTSAASRGEATDEQLFTSLLLEFRRNPKLVSNKISLQPGQDLVVFPDDIKRLIKLVQRVLHVKSEFSVDHTPERPILDAIYDQQFCSFPVSEADYESFKQWISPIVYDQRTVFKTKPSPEELDNQQTIRYATQQKLINSDFDAFGYPLPSSSKNKPYPTKLVHEITRSSFKSVTDDSLESSAATFRLQTPFRHFIHVNGQRVPGTYKFVANQFEQNCVNAESPSRHINFVSNLQATRVQDNINLQDILTITTPADLEPRVVSLPVLEARWHEDDDLPNVASVAPGEQITVVGLCISVDGDSFIQSQLKQLDNKRFVVKQIADKSAVVCQPHDFKDLLEHILPDQTRLTQVANLADCYNLGDVDDKLAKFSLDVECLRPDAVQNVRDAIVHNIIRFVDSMRTVIQECREFLTNQQTSTTESALSYYADYKAFAESLYDQALLTNCYTDVEAVEKLSNTVDNGDLFYYNRGTTGTTTNVFDDVKNAAENNAKELATVRQAAAKLSLTDDLIGLSDSVQEAISRPQNFLKKYSANVCLDQIERYSKYISFLEDLTHDIKQVLSGTVLVALTRSYQARLHRQRTSSNTTLATALQVPAQVISNFNLSDYETGEADELYTTVMNVDGKLVDLSNRPAVDLEYLSVELREKLSGQNPFPNPLNLFTTKPLIAIGNQLVVMMNPNKLNFVMLVPDFVQAVYDISDAFDELDDDRFYRIRYVRDRINPDTTAEDLEALKAEARQSFKDEIGSELEVKTNRRCAIILARLLVELETHRPKHPFKKIYALSGRKSIGSDDDTKYEMYSEENKINYLVLVASRPSDLGDKGRLMAKTQADNLKNIGTWVATYYDTFKQKRHISEMYDKAAVADLKQDIIKTESANYDVEKGIQFLLGDTPSIDSDRSAEVLSRFAKYDLNLESFKSALDNVERYRDYLTAKSDLRGFIRLLSLALLRNVQRSIEQAVQQDHTLDKNENYNPDQYGEERGSAACNPPNICILNTSSRLAMSKTDEIRKALAAEQLLYDVSPVRYFLYLRRCSHLITYNPAVLHKLHYFTVHDLNAYLKLADIEAASKDAVNIYYDFLLQKASFIDYSSHAKSYPKPPARLDVLHNIDKLITTIARLTHKPKQWTTEFSARLSSDLGKMNNVYQDQSARVSMMSTENVRHASPREKYLASAKLMRQFNLAFRKHISLLQNGLKLRTNDYTFTTRVDKPAKGVGFIVQDDYKALLSVRDLFADKYNPQDILYWDRKNDSYLLKYKTLANNLVAYEFVNRVTNITSVEPDGRVLTNEVSCELLLDNLVLEMISVLNYVTDRTEDATNQALVGKFCVDFINWCLDQQVSQDRTISDYDLAIAKRQESEQIKMSKMTKAQLAEMFLKRDAGLLVSYLDDEVGDERDEDQVADDEPYTISDGYDYADDEMKQNVFMDDDY